jgi:Ca2+-binding EF-hand superfamily protein
MGSFESKVADALDHPDNEKTVREVFEALDKDGNGTLDREEYRVFIGLLLGHDSSVLKSEV